MPDGVRPPGIFPKCSECQVNTRRFSDGDARASRAGIRHGCNLIGSKSVPWRIPEECWTAIRRDPRGTGSRLGTAASDTGASPVRATLGPEGRHGTLMRARRRARRVRPGGPADPPGSGPPEGWIRVGRARTSASCPGWAGSRGATPLRHSAREGALAWSTPSPRHRVRMAGFAWSTPGPLGIVLEMAGARGARPLEHRARDGRGAWSTPSPRHRVRMAGFAWSTPRPLGIVPEMAGARGARPLDIVPGMGGARGARQALGIVPGIAGFAWSTPVDIVPGMGRARVEPARRSASCPRRRGRRRRRTVVRRGPGAFAAKDAGRRGRPMHGFAPSAPGVAVRVRCKGGRGNSDAAARRWRRTLPWTLSKSGGPRQRSRGSTVHDSSGLALQRRLT